MRWGTPVFLNVVAADAHIGKVEQSIRAIKERNCATVYGLPFKRLPKVRVCKIVKPSVTCLNQLPVDDGLLAVLSPLTNMTGQANPDFISMTFKIGSYVNVKISFVCSIILKNQV
jgi:hypothetical protein